MINHDRLIQNHPFHRLTYFFSTLHSFIFLFNLLLNLQRSFLYCCLLIHFNPHYYQSPMQLMLFLLFCLLERFFELTAYFFSEDILPPMLLNLCSNELLLEVTLSKNYQPRKICRGLFQKIFCDSPLIRK